MRISAEGGSPELVAAVKTGDIAYGLQTLPGGRGTLFTLASGDSASPAFWDKARVVVQASKDSEPVTVVDDGTDGRYLPTGHIVFARRGRLFAVAFDVRSLKVTSADAVPVLEGVARGYAGAVGSGAAQFDVSRNGSLVYIAGPASNTTPPLFSLALLDETGKVERLGIPPGAYETPRVSPDGKRIAFATIDDTDANVWIYELAGTSKPRRLTFGGRNRFPVWSADSQYVAFQSDRNGRRAIFRQRADSSGPSAEPLTTAEAGTAHLPESWSRDDALSFSVEKGSRFSLSILSVRDGKMSAVEDVESAVPIASDFSPDGRWIAYTTAQQRTETTVFVRAYPIIAKRYWMVGERNNGFHPTWLRDGRTLSYSRGLRAGGPQWVLVPLTLDAGVSERDAREVPKGGFQDSVIERPLNGERNYDFRPDGRRVGLLRKTPLARQARGGPIHVVVNWAEELKQRVPAR
jgi:dipeptidyl aminopeptidase/acylaminoacyl peptidase